MLVSWTGSVIFFAYLLYYVKEIYATGEAAWDTTFMMCCGAESERSRKINVGTDNYALEMHEWVYSPPSKRPTVLWESRTVRL